MNKKTKKRLIIISSIVLALILAGIVLYLTLFQQSALQITDGGIPQPPQTESGIFKNVQVQLTSPYFGTLESGGNKVFCGDGTLTNSYSLGNTLDLITSLSNSFNNCGSAYNYLKAKLTVQGRIYGNCQVNYPTGENGAYDNGCEISNDYGFYYDAYGYQLTSRPDLRSKSDSFDVTYNKPTEITIIVKTSLGGTSGSANTKINLNYEPSNNINNPITECTNEKCEGNTYFACENSLYVNKGLIDGKCGYSNPQMCSLSDRVTKTCSDGSNIITKDCVSGSLIDTNNQCPSGTTIIPEQKVSSLNWIIWLVLSIVLILIIVLVVIIIKRRR